MTIKTERDPSRTRFILYVCCAVFYIKRYSDRVYTCILCYAFWRAAYGVATQGVLGDCIVNSGVYHLYGLLDATYHGCG